MGLGERELQATARQKPPRWDGVLEQQEEAGAVSRDGEREVKEGTLRAQVAEAVRVLFWVP